MFRLFVGYTLITGETFGKIPQGVADTGSNVFIGPVKSVRKIHSLLGILNNPGNIVHNLNINFIIAILKIDVRFRLVVVELIRCQWYQS